MNSTNDYIKKKWGERSQIELAKAIAKIIADERGKECGEKDYELYKGYVNKWFKTDQEPGKDYLVRLSKILNVSVESILIGEDVVCYYGDRATAYSAAKSGNPNIIEKLFGNYEADIQLHTTDEYEKSFIDYVIEFNNYSAFKIAIEKGYGYPIKSNIGQLVLGEYEVSRNADYQLTKMIIENDDLDMFIRAFGKDYADNESPNVVFFNGILREEQLLRCILKTTNILGWLIKYRPFSEIERKQITHLNADKHKTLQSVIDEIPSVIYGFNYLTNFCIENKLNQVLELILNQGINCVNHTEKIIKDCVNEFEVVNYNGSKETVIQLKSNWSGYPLAFVPYVYEYDKIEDIGLRDIAIMINTKIDNLR